MAIADVFEPYFHFQSSFQLYGLNILQRLKIYVNN